MIESTQSVNDLPYRARIMMNASSENGKRSSLCATSRNNVAYSCSSASFYADLQPLQWLQQDAILSIAPLDHEEEYVPGREDIVSVNTSPMKVEIVSDCTSIEQDSNERSTTIADFYRYQAMRAALASAGSQNGVRGQHGLCVGSLSRPSLSHTSNLNEYQKPPFSYTHIIFMAIETSPNKAMTVNDIYVWCETHFPYYTQAGVGWKNSLRHNLSINKSFKKISRDGRGGPGRGAYWVVEPRERNNLIDAIRRSPCSLGHFSFLNTMHPWASSNCYSSNLFPSSHSFKSNVTSISTTRSLITTKLTPTGISTTTDIKTNAGRGPLLRIGGQITDASHLIRSSPVIQCLNDSQGSQNHSLTLSASAASHIMSSAPVIQFDHINLESDPQSPNKSLFADNTTDDIYNTDESQCRGKVVISTQSDTEYDYGHITRGLIERDIDKSDSGRTESIKVCSEHSGNKKYRNQQHKSARHDSGVIEDILPPEDIAPLSREIIRKHCSMKQRKKCSCDKNTASDSDNNATSLSIEDYSEQSDTDYNWRSSLGRLKQCKPNKSLFFKKFKSLKNHRKLNCRSRVNNIIRAPHSDHVYALLQEFLPPANTEEVPAKIEPIDDIETYPIRDEEPYNPTDLPLTALSKRSKHKLQIKSKSSKTVCPSDSDKEGYTNTNGISDPRRFDRYYVSLKATKRKSKLINLKCLKHYSKENNHLSKTKILENCVDDDDEERENRYYDENSSLVRTNWPRFGDEDGFCGDSNHGSDRTTSRDDNSISTKKIKPTKEPLDGKRKVGRPKKSDHDSVISLRSTEQHVHKINNSGNKLKKKVKLLKNEIKYLKESNRNMKVESTVCKHEEQVAIDILVNLQRKSKQERINNMYNLSNFIDRSNSDSNMS